MSLYICECGKEFDNPQKFNGHKSHCEIHFNHLGKTYSIKERVDKQKQTVLNKYGSEECYNKQRSENIKKALKHKEGHFESIISNIDKEQFINDYITLNKPRSYMRTKYNIPSDYMMDKIVKEFQCKKSKQQSCKLGLNTKCLTYPVDNMNNWQKGHATRIQNFGSIEESYRQGKIKQKETMLSKYGTECLFNSPEILSHRKKRDTGPNNKFKNLLIQNGLEFEQEFVIESKSYDFKVGSNLIEINPTITHNAFKLPYPPYKGLTKEYHQLKSALAEKHGYRCIQVWEWEDTNKILNLLVSRPTVYARKCEVRKVPNIETNEFLDKFHFQGKSRSDVQLGLYYEGDLVSVMTFGKPRYNKNYEYELIRYCSSYNVIGGSSKLFKHFINEYNPHSIISYCDRSKFSGSTYLKLGFTYSKCSLGRHWYHSKLGIHITDNLLRQHGFDQLLGKYFGTYGKGTSNEELMYNNGFLDVYDCGQAVYIWKNN